VAPAFLMNALRQLGLLKGYVRRDAEDPEDHRVLALFRNRAELKKAYAALQDEIYRLKDRIKQQEGATLRTQEMLGVLETRLGLSESGFPALVFYQLRRLWQLGRELIEQFVAELARQLEERERRAHIAEHNRRQFARRQEVEARLNAAQTAAAAARERVMELNAAHARLTKLWHYFKRRAVARQRDAARAAAAVADLAMDAARQVSTEVEQEPQPEFPGAVGRGAAHHQPDRNRLRRSAVHAFEQDDARGARARGHCAPRGHRRIRLARRMRSAHGGNRARERAHSVEDQHRARSQRARRSAAQDRALQEA
jgi:hypothetical protein